MTRRQRIEADFKHYMATGDVGPDHGGGDFCLDCNPASWPKCHHCGADLPYREAVECHSCGACDDDE